ncbi:MAG: serine/threonine protein kinase [Planctomycetota bacterium]|nr:MAG: serine/threonine protein kinase [Planctomycetota bacterium]
MPIHQRLLVVRLLVAAFAVLSAAPLIAENWPNWRGPEGIGVSPEKDLPLEWSPSKNVRWKVKLPERGNSTPIVWGERVFVTQPLEKLGRRALVCFHRADGRQIWQVNKIYTEEEPTHPTNPYCSASPVTDGTRVIAWFGSAGVICCDLEGKQLWQRDLGVQEHEWGYAASPVIHGDLCFLNFGPGSNEFVIALDKHTGETKWRYDLAEPTPEQLKRDDGLRGSWSTPLVIRAGGREELIVTLPERVLAFSPNTGKELWNCEGLGSLVYTSPAWGDGILVALGGYHRAALAVKPGGQGDVTDSLRVWHEPKTRLRLGSGIVHEGHLYIGDMKSIVECRDLKTNKTVWEKRLASSGGADNESWSSLVLTGDERLYLLNQTGDTFVLAAKPEFELLATNPLGEPTNSSIVISDGEIFIRTHEHLWCIGK